MDDRGCGLQLWVNLPAAEKMTAPSYQGFEPADIPTLTADGVTLRVVAGELSGLHGVADTRSPVVYAHVTIEPGATFTTELPADDNVGLYVFAGRGTVGPDEREVNERGSSSTNVRAVRSPSPQANDSRYCCSQAAPCTSRWPVTARS